MNSPQTKATSRIIILKWILKKYQILLFSFVLGVLTLAAFEPIRYNGFIILDDSGYIIDNPHVQSGFTSKSIAWAFTTGREANWHPLTWLSHILDVELFGLNPLGTAQMNELSAEIQEPNRPSAAP
jgi:hypothetical protein